MLQEIAELGFSAVELSHGIRISLVPGILRAVELGRVRVTSTHNFCPLPTGVARAAPNLYEPSASRPQEFDQWVRHTRRSIDFAAQVGAQVLVCHLGRVEFFWFNPARAVVRYLRSHPEAGRNPLDGRYRALVEKSLARLHRRMAPFWTRVQAGLRQVSGYAQAKGVKLGIENREAFDELPLDADFGKLLAEFSSDSPVGYWHDTGHAHLKESMGLLDHANHVRALASRTLGFHLHDVGDEGRDHQAIGAGQIDFAMLSQFWRPEQLLTIELSPRVRSADVVASKARIESLLSPSLS